MADTSPADTPEMADTSPAEPPRRTPLQMPVVVVTAVAGALAAVGPGLQPTGNRVVDTAEMALVGAVIALLAARATWITAALVATASTLLASGPPAVAFGVLAGLSAVLTAGLTAGPGDRAPGSRRADVARAVRELVRGLGGAATVATLCRLGWPGVTGGPTAVAVVLVAALAIDVRRHRTGTTGDDAPGRSGPKPALRRSARTMAALGVGTVAASTAWTAVAAVRSRDDLSAARIAAEATLDAVADGRLGDARDHGRTAREAFGRTRDRVDTPWGSLAALVPVVAQHRRLAITLSSGGEDLTSVLDRSLDTLQSGELRPRSGRIDLDAVDRAAPTVRRAAGAVDRLDDAVERSVADVWVAGPLKDRLERLRPRLQRARRDADTGILAVEAGRTLLGAAGPRRYVVLFMNPAEARGLGGHSGNFAELRADRGRLELTRFGRIGELFPAPGTARVTGTAEWRKVWGRLGGDSGPGGTVVPDYWLNVTMPPDLPTVGAVVAELYPQVAGGGPVDGVMALDPYGLTALLRLTGPVDVPALGRQLGPDEALGFLLRDQYRQFVTKDTRIDMLESLAEATAGALLGGADLPDLPDLARILSPMARANHMTMWSRHPAEQRLLRRVGADQDFRAERTRPRAELDDARPGGGSPTAVANDEIAVTFQNISKSKLDAFLRRAWSYEVALGPGDAIAATVTVELTNEADPTGLPPYVYGDRSADDPTLGRAGTSVVVYSSMAPTRVRLDGRDVPVSTWQEYGRWAMAVNVETASRATSRLIVEVGGILDTTDGYRLVARTQTSGSTPDEVRVRVRRTGADRNSRLLLDDQFSDRASVRWVLPVP